MDLAQVVQPAVVLCPPLTPDTGHPEWVARAERALRAAGIPTLAPRLADPPHPPPGSTPDPAGDRLAVAGWVADQAIAITAAQLGQPLLLVAHGAAIRGVPALAMSQRAARHNVVGYVLVDGPPPSPSPGAADWPDAPVLYVRSTMGDPEELRQMRLRGWQVARDDPAQVVAAHARAWPDHA